MLGSIAAVFALLGRYIASVVCLLLFLASGALFYRAVFTAPKALGSKQTRFLAWGLLLFPGAASTVALVVEGSPTGRLLMLGSGLYFLVTGILGVRSQRDDA